MIRLRRHFADFSNDQVSAGFAALRGLRMPECSARAELPWCLVRTAYRREVSVRDDLVEAGWDTYLPLTTAWEGRARRKHRATRPLFPGYLFAACVDDDADPAAPAEVRHLVAIRRPAMKRVIRPGQMLRLMLADGLGAFDYTKEKPQLPSHGLAVGDLVKVLDGPFHGFEARIEEVLNDKRVVAHLWLFGRLTNAEFKGVDLQVLTPAAEAA